MGVFGGGTDFGIEDNCNQNKNSWSNHGDGGSSFEIENSSESKKYLAGA